ncbi:MAG: hypothetical protein KAH21_11355, partial [Spirochaetaceae bacterium]|nr:hypothetical protein [Spirochaetaceae bacterium]
RVDVECAGRYTTGATVVSFAEGVSHAGAAGRVPLEKANVDVLFDVDREAFVSLLRDALEVLD